MILHKQNRLYLIIKTANRHRLGSIPKKNEISYLKTINCTLKNKHSNISAILIRIKIYLQLKVKITIYQTKRKLFQKYEFSYFKTHLKISELNYVYGTFRGNNSLGVIAKLINM